MAKALTIHLRDKITSHLCQLYFPQEVFLALVKQIQSAYTKYLYDNFSDDLNSLKYKTTGTIYLKSEDLEYLKDSYSRYGYGRNQLSFVGILANLPFFDKEDDQNNLDIDICPISDLVQCAIAYNEINRELTQFKTLLNSELLKSSSVEGFVKKYPELKSSLSSFLDNQICDLPNELKQVEVNLSTIAI